MSTYRDDLEAAQARADAAAEEAKRLRKEVARLAAQQSPSASDDDAVPIPERFAVTHAMSELTVRWRWFRGYHVLLLLFAIAWNAFLVFWYSGAVSERSAFMLVFPIVHVAVGLLVAYYAVTGFVNSTSISVAHGWLRVHHGPLYWPGNRVLASDEVLQLFVSETRHRHRHHHHHGHHTSHHVESRLTYNLCAVVGSGREVTLLRGLETLAQGRYLEQAFERYLGIADRRVVGEVSKTATM